MTVRAGTTLMEEGTTVVPQTVEMINAYNRRLASWSRRATADEAGGRFGADADRAGGVRGLAAAPSRGLFEGAANGCWCCWGCWRSPRALYRYLSVGLNWIPPWLAPFAMPIALPTMLAVLLLGAPAALAMGLWSACRRR
jgi:hypothetical protein